MVKRSIGPTIFPWEFFRAKRISREELREDIELYLYSIFRAERMQDKELLESAKKDLEKAERLLLAQSFLQVAKIPTSELKEKTEKEK